MGADRDWGRKRSSWIVLGAAAVGKDVYQDAFAVAEHSGHGPVAEDYPSWEFPTVAPVVPGHPDHLDKSKTTGHSTSGLAKKRGSSKLPQGLCVRCHSLWRREQHQNLQHESDSTTMMAIGKHQGKSFRYIFEHHPDYALWAIGQTWTSEDMHPNLRALAKWSEEKMKQEAALREDDEKPLTMLMKRESSSEDNSSSSNL
eukprot:749659-Amphidinium_carterae.3